MGSSVPSWTERKRLCEDLARRLGVELPVAVMSTITEEAVLTEARDALERYAGRLPGESAWRERFEGIAEGLAAGAESADDRASRARRRRAGG